MKKINGQAKEKDTTFSFLIEIFSNDNKKIKKIKELLKELKLKFDATILKNY